MITPEQIRAQLGRILASASFDQADRASAFLSFVVTTSLEGQAGEIKESVIAIEALGRTTAFDPKSDPIVRVEAGRLRNRLKAFYDSEGSQDSILITLPKGGYVPEFASKIKPVGFASARNPVVLIVAGMLAGIALATIGLLIFRKTPVARDALHLSVIPPPGSTIQSSRISPNGKLIAFTALHQNRTMLWVRSLDAAEARVIPGTERATQAFWSPDSRSLAFFGPDTLRRVELSGGPAQKICDVSIPMGGGSWSRNGVIVFSPRPEGALFRVSATGGVSQPVTALDRSRDELTHRSPEFLPDGQHFLYVATSGRPEGTTLRVGSISSMDSKVILETAGNAAYAPPAGGKPGALLFYFRGALMTQPFDPDRLTLIGDRTVLAPEVYYRHGRADFSASENSVLAYLPKNRRGLQLSWFDRAGRLIRNIGAPNNYFSLRLSPDEKRIIFGEEEDLGSKESIWVMELAQGQVSRVTDLPHSSFLPVWSPDGNEILFGSGNEQRMKLLRQSLNSTTPTTVLDSPGPKFPTAWSTSGQYLTYFTPWPEFVRLKTVVLDLKNIESNKNPQVLLMESQYNEAEAALSPDAAGPRWIAYTSTETGRPEVYVRNFPGGDRKWPISNGGAWQPLWRKDGREIFFLSQDGVLMAADIRVGKTFEAGVPHPVFRTTIPPYPGPPHVPANAYAVSNDGQQFLVNQATNDPSKGSISIVTDWQARRP